MIKIEKQVHSVPIITVWFADGEIDDDGIIDYKEARIPIGRSIPFLTLISDLNESEDEIKAHFSKGCRYEVNRAYRENVEFHILDSDEIDDETLEAFLDFFEEFWESKNSSIGDRASLAKDLKKYRDCRAFSIGYAVVKGEIAVYHTYIHDDDITRLLHSASLFRLKNDADDTNKNVIGMANRALHFEEMKYFKAKGISVYDWGGAGKEEEVASITKFKEFFGGTPVTYYDCEQIKGTKAKLVSDLSSLKQRLLH